MLSIHILKMNVHFCSRSQVNREWGALLCTAVVISLSCITPHLIPHRWTNYITTNPCERQAAVICLLDFSFTEVHSVQDCSFMSPWSDVWVFYWPNDMRWQTHNLVYRSSLFILWWENSTLHSFFLIYTLCIKERTNSSYMDHWKCVGEVGIPSSLMEWPHH